VTDQDDWRVHVRDYALDQRLIGCPISADEALATASVPNVALTAWCRESLAAGVMLQTSQAEHIREGRSLEETARITGISVEGVLAELTRLEEEESEVTAFYFRGDNS
jgi:hypothetical protein